MKVSLPQVSFGVGRPVRPEMVDAVNLALDEDIKYELPKNYLRGEGDSEFLVVPMSQYSAGDYLSPDSSERRLGFGMTAWKAVAVCTS